MHTRALAALTQLLRHQPHVSPGPATTNHTTMSHLSKTDTHLYGAPRPKRTPIPLSSTSIHALSTELDLARSAAPPKTSTGRARPSKLNPSLYTPNKGVHSRAARDLAPHDGPHTEVQLGSKMSVAEMARARKKMVDKARLYKQLQRGEVDDASGASLVDFTGKWAKGDRESDEEEEGAEEEGGDGELVEYEDEFGRTRKGTRAAAAAAKRAVEAEKNAAEEMERKQRGPENVIYGNTIQTHAFQTGELETLPQDGDLSKFLPAEEEGLADAEAHYDGSKEVRTKGVGFYQFSADNEQRRREMGELLEEREKTERERVLRREKGEKRRREIEERREEIKRRKRGKVGAGWLAEFEKELIPGKEKEEEEAEKEEEK